MKANWLKPLGYLAGIGTAIGLAIAIFNTPDPTAQRINELAEESNSGLIELQWTLCNTPPQNASACERLEQSKREYKAKYGKEYVRKE